MGMIGCDEHVVRVSIYWPLWTRPLSIHAHKSSAPDSKVHGMGLTWVPSGADRTQVGLMLAQWTLLSGANKLLWVIFNFSNSIALFVMPIRLLNQMQLSIQLSMLFALNSASAQKQRFAIHCIDRPQYGWHERHIIRNKNMAWISTFSVKHALENIFKKSTFCSGLMTLNRWFSARLQYCHC